MRKDKTIEEFLHMAEKALEGLMRARPRIDAHVHAALQDISNRLNLVTREEFDALHAVLSKTRLAQEEIMERLESLEKRMNHPRSSQKVTTKKRSLRSVKHGNRRKQK